MSRPLYKYTNEKNDMEYVKLSGEFIGDAKKRALGSPVNEGLFSGIGKSVLEKTLAPTLDTGDDIFKSINESVDEIEELVNHYNDDLKINKKNASNRVEQMLTVEFDKNKLKLNRLIELTTIKSGSFTGDILLSNIMNYMVFLSPIRMGKIMALGYKYYMTIIRQALQQALVTIELNADMFFTLVKDGVAGTDKKFIEMRRLAIEQMYDEMKSMIGTDYVDGTTGKVTKLTKKESNKMNNLLDAFKKMKGVDNRANNDYGGYRQNIFQDAGRHIESMLRDDNQKELASMAEMFTTLAQKPSKEGRDNMLATYAQSVKLAAEMRANKVCSKMQLNMLDILKMFSIRTQEGLASLFDGFEHKEEWEKDMEERQKEYEALKNRNEELSKKIDDQNKTIEDLMEQDENKKEMKESLDKMGFGELPKQDMYKDVVLGKRGEGDMLKANGFNNMQIKDIIVRKIRKVTDYTYDEDRVNEDGVPAEWKLKSKKK